VQFTCIGQDIRFLAWFVDGTEVAQYTHELGDENRLPFPVAMYDGDLGPILITYVMTSLDSDDINVTSSFTTNTSILEGYSYIQCGTRANVKSDNVTLNTSVLGKSPEHVECTR
jgi:hypothetical protein